MLLAVGGGKGPREINSIKFWKQFLVFFRPESYFDDYFVTRPDIFRVRDNSQGTKTSLIRVLKQLPSDIMLTHVNQVNGR